MGATVTDAMGNGAVTVTEAVPLASPLVAVIATSPSLMPVTVASLDPAMP